MRNTILFVLAIFVLFTCQFALANVENEHEALRQLRVQITHALNSENFELMKPLLDNHFTLITVDNRKFTTLQDFKTYWENLFNGENAIFQKIEVHPVADELTQFLSPTIGVISGKSEDRYYFKDGDVRTMTSLWTATLKKDNAAWKIVSLHFSANLLDNPVLTAIKTRAYLFGVIGLFVGFITALGITMLRSKRHYLK